MFVLKLGLANVNSKKIEKKLSYNEKIDLILNGV
jgi:hypothetical protein